MKVESFSRSSVSVTRVMSSGVSVSSYAMRHGTPVAPVQRTGKWTVAADSQERRRYTALIVRGEDVMRVHVRPIAAFVATADT